MIRSRKIISQIVYLTCGIILLLSPTFSYAKLSGTNYDIIDELFDNGGGANTGSNNELPNATLGQWDAGKNTGNSYTDLRYHGYKDITDPEVSTFSWWNADPENNPFLIGIRWLATDYDYAEFDTGLETNGYDVDFQVTDAGGGVSSWYNIHPSDGTVLDPADLAFGATATETKNIDIEDIVQALGSPFDVSDTFTFRLRALDRSGNIVENSDTSEQFGKLWFQGVDGTVYARNNLSSEISSFSSLPYIIDDSITPPNPPVIFPPTRGGVPISGNLMNAGFGIYSERGLINTDGWNLQNYGDIEILSYNDFYSYLYDDKVVVIPNINKDTKIDASELLSAINNNPTATKFYASLALSMNGSFNKVSNRDIVILASSTIDFTVNPEFLDTSSYAFIAQGDVVIYNEVTDIKNSLIFSDNTLQTRSTDTSTSRLEVVGSLIGRTELIMNREMDPGDEQNLIYPTERVILSPKLFFTLGLSESILGTPKITWEEIE